MRVLVVDDSAFMRKMITRMIEEARGLEVIAQARNGREGVELAEKLKPDLITLDIEMPELDGLGALRQIRIRCRKEDPAILMCSSLTTEGSAEALKALRLGAADVIAKDPAVVGKNDDGFRKELITKLKAVGASRLQRRRAGTPAVAPPTPRPDTPAPRQIDLSGIEAVLIGSSTGGPPVLEDILAPLPPGLRVPVFVAQHMPGVFTKTLAARLDQHCANGARLIAEPVAIEGPGIYVAEGGRHLHLESSRGVVRAEMRAEPADALYRPSVNVLYSTGARAYRGRVLGIQLTGMGDDGAKGASELRRAGGIVIAQHESTCVVYGMPKAVVESGQADGVMTPAQIAGLLAGLCGPAGVQHISEELRKSA